jgi:hypothetical protein
VLGCGGIKWGVASCGSVWYGMAGCDDVWRAVACCGGLWQGVARYDVVRWGLRVCGFDVGGLWGVRQFSFVGV